MKENSIGHNKTNGRNWLGIELKQEYIEMAMRRINEAETGVPVAEAKQGQMGLFERKENAKVN